MASVTPNPASLLDGTSEVLAAVRRHGCTTRAQIQRRTGLSRMVTAQRVDQLLQLGLLHDEGPGASEGGRPPRQLTFHPPGYLIVADVGWTRIHVAIADLVGNLVAHAEEPTDVTTGPEAVLGHVEKIADRLRTELENGDPLWGVGIGIPAPVEFREGRAVSPPGMPAWDGYLVAQQLTTHFGTPAWVDKDVNIMMLGEWRQGAAAGHDNVVFIKVGTGTGVGVMSGGRLHRGAQGSAGDVGHLLALANYRLRYKLEGSGDSPDSWLAAGIAREAQQLADEGRSRWLADAIAGGREVSTRLVAEAAAHGDASSIDLLHRAGYLVGTTLASVVSLLNPSVVVVGGGISQAGDVFIAAIREAVYGQSTPLSTRDLQIVKAGLGSTAGVMGATSMVQDELFGAKNLRTTVARWLAMR